MEMTEKHADCCIVGGGASGLLLGLLLARRGRNVTVLEKGVRFESAGEGAVLLLQPGTLGIFDHLGVLDALKEGSEVVERVEEYDADGLLFSREYRSVDGSPVPYALTVPLGTIKRALLDLIEGESSIALHPSTTVMELRPTAAGRYDVIASSDPERPLRVSASVVVGGDGKFSAVREMAGIETDILEFDHRHLMLRVPRPGRWPRSIRFYRHPRYLFSIPVGGSMLQILWRVDDGELEELKMGPVGDLARQISTVEPALGESVGRYVSDWREILTISYHTVSPRTWRRRNVVLLGDSAHAMHPFGDQGLNTSLQDAVLLARMIERALEFNDMRELALYDQIRRPYIQTFQARQRELLVGRATVSQDAYSAYEPDFENMALGQPELRNLYIPALPGGRGAL